MTEATPVDHAALFLALPTPYLVMTPDLVIAEVNAAYEEVVGRARADLVGRPVFEAFPPMPDALNDEGVSFVQVALEQVRDTGLPVTMPLQKYDIPGPQPDAFVERYWSLICVPVLDAAGRTRLIMQRAEDVTDFVRERRNRQDEQQRGDTYRRQVEAAEVDLYARALELQTARDAEDAATRRLAALAEVALQLSLTETVAELATVVVERGMTALGANGGAIAVRSEDDVLRLAVTDSLGAQTRVDYAVLPLDGPLPGSVSARTGQRLLLADQAACLDWSDQMADVITSTGCQAWASLPLRVRGRSLGSLSVGWATAHEFTTAEVETLDALAAQCAFGLERIQSREAERAAAARATRMSETLQRSLLTSPPQPDHLQVAVRYRPAAQEAQVGGDWYDAFSTADGSTVVVIGDVTGHDRDAAAVMGQMRNLLRGVAYAASVAAPGAVLSVLDQALRDLAMNTLATLVLARVEPLQNPLAVGAHRLRWSNAGHLPPVLVEPDGQVRLLTTAPDLLLGLDPATDRADHETVLLPGSALLLYTDGLIERRGASIEDGLAWLEQAVRELVGQTVEELCDELLRQVGSDAEDDIALLVLRALPVTATVSATVHTDLEQADELIAAGRPRTPQRRRAPGRPVPRRAPRA